jgi:hypothetical protein
VTYSRPSRARRPNSIPLFLLLLIGSYRFASADTPKPKPSLCNLTEAEVAGLNGDASTDIHAMSNYSETMYGLLQAGKFEQLDCLADLARSNKETFPGGMWKIHAVYTDLVRPPLHPTNEDWIAHIELVQRWVSARPESITARIALAATYANYGEDARGRGRADTVSESGWKLLAERTAKAKQILEEASTLTAKDPEWYVAMQQVALLQGWKPAAKQALLEQAIKSEPAYYYYYRMYGFSILPMWDGEDGEVSKFLQKTADQIGGDSGDILYFRVAAYLVCGCQNDQQLNLSWPRIQKGFDAVEKRNGPSPENWNLMAHMAQSFNDPILAYTLFTRIGDQWSESVWQTSSDFESAKQWAQQVKPFVAKRQAAEESAETNLQTPEGQRYNAAFAEKIHTWMQLCTDDPGGSNSGKSELLLKVGKEGTIADMTGGGSVSALTRCLGQKLNDFRLTNQAVLPPPPQPDYWVRYDFDFEKSTSAALK